MTERHPRRMKIPPKSPLEGEPACRQAGEGVKKLFSECYLKASQSGDDLLYWRGSVRISSMENGALRAEPVVFCVGG